MKHLLLLCLLFITLSSYAQPLTFEQPVGTTAWMENGHQWVVRDSLATYIDDELPYTGMGHLAFDGWYPGRLEADAPIDIPGMWITTNYTLDLWQLWLYGYDDQGNVLYTDTLTPSDYDDHLYHYHTMNWTGVTSLSFYVDQDPVYGQTRVYIDDFQYNFSSLSVMNQQRVKPQLYPNPATHQVTIAPGFFQHGQVVITDLTGRLVFEANYSNNERMVVTVENWSTGIYLVSTVLDGVASNTKLVKE